jgi:flavodoxin/ferredoxin
MKSIVIYFSQTGNTEKVAFAIQSGIKQVSGQCDIARLQDSNPRRLYEYDLIGLGSAVYSKELGNLAIFLNKLRFVGGKHAFFFCTHGSATHGGEFFPAAYRRAKKSGLVIIGTADWYGDCYMLHMPEPYPTAGHPDEIDLKEAEEFGREIVVRSWRIMAGETGLIPPEPSAPEIPDLPKILKLTETDNERSGVHSFSKKLKFYKEKCLYPKCLLCMENCPVTGIDLSVNPPVVAQPCLSCEFCARLCPTGALNMDEWVKEISEMTKDVIPLMVLPALEKAESEGLFRRLIPASELDLNKFGYMVHKNHPQWIIGKGKQ